MTSRKQILVFLFLSDKENLWNFKSDLEMKQKELEWPKFTKIKQKHLQAENLR